jgi:O-antigen/teichoic acid export membrane protein
LLTFPALIGLAAVGEPLFHTLFGHKWDAAIILFQILSIRGIFVVLTQLYYNYTVSLGRSRAMIAIETAKDALVFIAIPATIFSGSLEVLVWGQAAASLITFVIALAISSKATGYGAVRMLKDLVPFLAISVLSAAAAMLAGSLIASPMLMLSAEIAMGALAYIWMLKTLRIPELPEMASYLLGRFRKK